MPELAGHELRLFRPFNELIQVDAADLIQQPREYRQESTALDSVIVMIDFGSMVGGEIFQEAGPASEHTAHRVPVGAAAAAFTHRPCTKVNPIHASSQPNHAGTATP